MNNTNSTEATCTVPWCDLTPSDNFHEWFDMAPGVRARLHMRTVGAWRIELLEHEGPDGQWFDEMACTYQLDSFTEPHDALELADELHEVARVMEDAQATVLTGFLGQAGGVA